MNDDMIHVRKRSDSKKLIEAGDRFLIFKEGEKHRIVIRTSTLELSLDISKEAAENLLKVHVA